ncbi:MAG: hypothetical protein LBD53_08075 [Tannerella sp.]|nr:hypothetical protein [Tannerella sp.]
MLKKICTNTARWLMITLFLCYYISTTSFPHTHHFAWGTVSHSHLYFPFGDSPINHTHTQTQCNIIALMSKFVATAAVAAIVMAVAMTVRIIYTAVYSYISHRACIFLPLRAPPGWN